MVHCPSGTGGTSSQLGTEKGPTMNAWSSLKSKPSSRRMKLGARLAVKSTGRAKRV
jgi:hypothetical protein